MSLTQAELDKENDYYKVPVAKGTKLTEGKVKYLRSKWVNLGLGFIKKHKAKPKALLANFIFLSSQIPKTHQQLAFEPFWTWLGQDFENELATV